MATKTSELRLTLLDHVSGPARRVGGALAALNRQSAATMAPIRGIIGQAVAFGGAYLGVTKGISSTAGAAIKFEEAFADVRKVLDANDEQMENVRRSILSMSRELPIAAEGIAAIYAAAGQSNIPLTELNQFAEMVAKFSVAWDTTEADTGQALAEIKNQLHLTVKDVGLFADSLNHLSNNTAANAPKLLEYTKRVAATGEMFGFSAQETLAFGGAMIAAGGESEVAATSFRNMGRALTIGTRATKSHNIAFNRLGLDSVRTAKNMQKNALKTTLDVIERIQTLPEWERISIASALFGDEARALMPLINNSTELRRQLGLVGDQANYAGSAFKEYMIRADTVSNALAILRNKIADTFRGIGDDMLPGIKEAALEFGRILDTLGSRASVFDEIKYALKGFTQGLGYDGGIKEVIRDLGDLLFGKEDPSGAADRLGGVFAKFEQYGQSVRQFKKDLDENPIVKFFKDLSPWYVDALKWSVGFLVVSAAVRKLASAIWFLSGASTIVGALKALGGVATALGIGGGGLDKVIGAAGTSAGSIYGKAFGLAAKAAIVAGIALAVGEVLQTFDPKGNLGGVTSPVDNWLRDKMGLPARDSGITPGELFDGFGNILPDFKPTSSADTDDGGRAVSMDAYLDDFAPKQEQYEGGRHRAGAGVGPQPGEGVVRYARSGLPATIGIGRTLPGIGLLERNLSTLPSQWQQDRPVTLDAGTIGQLLQPTRGVQEVRVTNKEPPQIHLSVTQNITGVSSPQEAADQAASRLGQAVKSAVESADTD